MLNFDTKNNTITIHGTLDVHGSIREDPCEIELSTNVDTKLYEVCGQKNTVIVTKATKDTTTTTDKVPTLLLPDFDSVRIHGGYRVTIVSGAEASEDLSAFQLKVDSDEYVLNGQLRSSVEVPKIVALVDCITTSAYGTNGYVNAGLMMGKWSPGAPGSIFKVTVKASWYLKEVLALKKVM